MAAAQDEDDGQNGGDASAAPRFVRAGLELLDLDADDAELAVIEAADGLYRPLITSLLEAELDGVDPEPEDEMSRPPA
jgi:hypothetical protein